EAQRFYNIIYLGFLVGNPKFAGNPINEQRTGPCGCVIAIVAGLFVLQYFGYFLLLGRAKSGLAPFARFVDKSSHPFRFKAVYPISYLFETHMKYLPHLGT